MLDRFNETIYAHRSSDKYFPNSTHVQDCSNFCLKHNPSKMIDLEKTEDEAQEMNSTVEETTGEFDHLMNRFKHLFIHCHFRTLHIFQSNKDV